MHEVPLKSEFSPTGDAILVSDSVAIHSIALVLVAHLTLRREPVERWYNRCTTADTIRGPSTHLCLLVTEIKEVINRPMHIVQTVAREYSRSRAHL